MGFTLQCLLGAMTLSMVSIACCKGVTWPNPPKWTAKAEMARYLTHYADWGILSAISPEFGHQPFGTLQSFSDGTLGNSTGTLYFYISKLSDTAKNIQYNNTVSFSVSQAMSDYCHLHNLDPEEPLCSRVTVTGHMVPVVGKEQLVAKVALFVRHPAMRGWPSGHSWKFYKIALTGVYLLDYYGGCTHVSISDYYKARPNFSGLQFENSVLYKH